MPTLVIIDMQTGFDVSKDAIEEVVRRVHFAKERKAPIVVVEYAGCGETISNILNAVGTYELQTVVNKRRNDGSSEVIEACNKQGFDLDRVQVCGLYISYCVRETVEGLLYKVPHCTVELIVRGCHCKVPAALDAPWTVHNRLRKVETEASDEQRVRNKTIQEQRVYS